MKIYCVGLVLIVFFFISVNAVNAVNAVNVVNAVEGFKVPPRHIDPDLQDYLKMGIGGNVSITDKTKQKRESKVSDISKKYKHRSNFESVMAKNNMKLCKDTNQYHACGINSPSPPKLDMRYLTLPSQELNSSNIYNQLSICPQTYQKNMDILHKKISLGQYSGYTDNAYIDRTRYLTSKEPLPVNPDFFMKGGGTYA